MPRRSHQHRFRLALLGVVCGFAAGCGSSVPRGEVEGTVRCNGKPLANVLVTFIPEAEAGPTGMRSFAVTDAKGQYRLQGEDKQPGAIVGAYRVTLEDLAVYSASRDRDGTILKMPPRRFPARFGAPLQTTIRKSVVAGSQILDLEIPADP